MLTQCLFRWSNIFKNQLWIQKHCTEDFSLIFNCQGWAPLWILAEECYLVQMVAHGKWGTQCVFNIRIINVPKRGLKNRKITIQWIFAKTMLSSPPHSPVSSLEPSPCPRKLSVRGITWHLALLASGWAQGWSFFQGKGLDSKRGVAVGQSEGKGGKG